MSGIHAKCENGLLWTQTTDGQAFCLHPDAILSAKPNPHAQHVTFVWLKGHSRFTAIDCSIGELFTWLTDLPTEGSKPQVPESMHDSAA